METAMMYLDVSPMISALRVNPKQFEIRNGWLRHMPSKHDFAFEQDGHVRIHARCNCAMLMVGARQEKELIGEIRQWRSNYWRPLMINREFASHFAPPSRMRRWLIQVVEWAHDRLSRPSHAHEHYSDREFPIPAE
jgi:hypothetical protein